MRTIGILGPSYCGSTMLGCILGSLPGVAYVGESHWLYRGEHKCRCRQPDCPLEHVAINGSGWWEGLARALDADVIVSGDKNFNNFRPLGNPDVAMILCRDPRAWVVSYHHYKTMREGKIDLTLDELPPPSALSISNYIHLWGYALRMSRSWCDAHGIPYLVVDLSTFLEEPETELQHLCELLGLDFDADALHFERKTHHHVGGNSQVGMKTVFGHRPRFHAERRKLNGGYPRPDTAWKQVLTKEQASFVMHLAGG
jgi:hypothetical protein